MSRVRERTSSVRSVKSAKCRSRRLRPISNLNRTCASLSSFAEIKPSRLRSKARNEQRCTNKHYQKIDCVPEFNVEIRLRFRRLCVESRVIKKQRCANERGC